MSPPPTSRLLGGFLHLGTKMKLPIVANDNVDSVRLFAGNIALALNRADVDAALSGFVVAMARNQARIDHLQTVGVTNDNTKH